MIVTAILAIIIVSWFLLRKIRRVIRYLIMSAVFGGLTLGGNNFVKFKNIVSTTYQTVVKRFTNQGLDQ